MGLQLVEKPEKDDTISFRNMKVGQVAKIVVWGEYTDYVGCVIIRTNSSIAMLVALDGGSHWTADILISTDYPCINHRVRVLPKGTLLEVQ